MNIPTVAYCLYLLFDLDVAQLDDTISSLILSSSLPLANNLSPYLGNYFQDGYLGRCFRSMMVYGRQDGDAVSLAYFNKFVMLPRSSNKFKLYRTHLPVHLIPVTDIARTKLNRHTLLLGYETVEEVLNFFALSIPGKRKFSLLSKLWLFP
jgi:hypothetical protein